jgi:hypothetical protein
VWLVPELLERGDRCVLTGREGYGKSTLLRQIGLGAALGLNTLSTNTLDPVHTPATVLLVDLENTPRQLRREFRKALNAVAHDRVERLTERFFVESRSEGLVLDDVRDREGDRRWLEETIEGTRPELLIIGPIYKMIDGEPSEEVPNRNLVKWLDRLRVLYDLALLLEAHSPHDANRPYGWSGWKRWPEFGLHLHEDGRLDHWRGQRDERNWPARLTKGVPADWLWLPDSGTPFTEPRDKHEELIVTCEMEALRQLRKANRTYTGNELVELLGRRKASVYAALARLKERGILHVTQEERHRSNGRPYSTDVFAINPDSHWKDPIERCSRVPGP